MHLTHETTEPAWSWWARLLGVTTLLTEALQSQERASLPRWGHGLGLQKELVVLASQRPPAAETLRREILREFLAFPYYFSCLILLFI